MTRPITVALHDIGVKPNVAQNNAMTKTRGSAGAPLMAALRGTKTMGMWQSRRTAIKCILGYGKQHGILPCARPSTAASPHFLLNLIAYNLVRIPKLPT